MSLRVWTPANLICRWNQQKYPDNRGIPVLIRTTTHSHGVWWLVEFPKPSFLLQMEFCDITCLTRIRKLMTRDSGFFLDRMFWHWWSRGSEWSCVLVFSCFHLISAPRESHSSITIDPCWPIGSDPWTWLCWTMLNLCCSVHLASCAAYSLSISMSAETTRVLWFFLKSDRHLTLLRDWERSRRYRSLDDCFRFLKANSEAFLFTAVHADFDALLVDDCIDEAHASELELVKVENSQRSSRNTVVPIISWIGTFERLGLIPCSLVHARCSLTVGLCAIQKPGMPSGTPPIERCSKCEGACNSQGHMAVAVLCLGCPAWFCNDCAREKPKGFEFHIIDWYWLCRASALL